MNTFRNLNQPTGKIIYQGNQEYLFFGGTAYLGLLDNPEYINLYKEGIDKLGLNNGTSRSNNVQLGIYNEAEEKLSQRFGFEASALFSSGYLAAQAVVKALTKEREVIYAPDCHPALWLDGNPEVFIPFSEWLKGCVESINFSSSKNFAIISNCIDNLKPEAYDFRPLNKIHSDKHVVLILDDSHGIGIKNYNSISMDRDSISSPNIELVAVASLAKGLGTDAGIVLGSKDLIGEVKRSPIFNGASPSSPAAIYALTNSESIYQEVFKKLHENIDLFSGLLNHSILNYLEDFPVFSSNSPHLYKHLLQKGVLISSFPYPLPSSPLLNRVVLSSLHSKDDIESLYKILTIELH